AAVVRRGRTNRPRLPRTRIPAAELVRRELREEDGYRLPRPDDAVGVGARGRDVVLHDLAGRGIETPDAVPGLLGEPDHPVRALDRRVRARAIVRERILAEALGLRGEGGGLVATLLGRDAPAV